jgi:cyanophycin synthetase
VILKEDADRRGRRRGEIAALMREGARAGGLPDSAIEEVLEERAAVRRVVDALEDGDLGLILAVDVPGVLEELAAAGATG